MKQTAWYCTVLAACLATGCPKNSKNAESFGATLTQSDALRVYLDEVYEKQLANNPVAQHYQGIKDQQDQWTLWTEAYRLQNLADANTARDTMKERFAFDTLDRQGQLNYQLYDYQIDRMNEAQKWRLHGYGITQMHGTHAWIPSFLINVHRIESREDAEAYIKRLQSVGEVVELAISDLLESFEAGVLPPAFVFPMIIDDCENLLRGAPFSEGPSGTWLEDFEKKILTVKSLTDEEQTTFTDQARQAILQEVGPAYRKLLSTLLDLQAKATDDDGVWKLPDGDEYYAFRLRQTTTTTLGAEEIHTTGLAEVERIHQEMEAIKTQVGFEGSLNEFFEHLRTDPKFFYANDEEGRQQYLKHALKLIRSIEDTLPRFFITTPKAPLEVKAVEAYREKSAGKAFYSRGTPDGSRPGTYYANLYDMNSMPIYQMEALAYHEGIPGHHLQNSITQEIKGIARFRQFSGYTAYGEGWGLYSEYLPKEMGFYKDPYSDFGRLSMELWRACRLVVDTGLHHKKWTREEAINYLMENTPNPEADAVKAIERYIVMPGQATGYKIGMLKILSLRARAKEALGDRFSLPEFHEVVLTNGSVPLEVLEDLIEEWIREKNAGP